MLTAHQKIYWLKMLFSFELVAVLSWNFFFFTQGKTKPNNSLPLNGSLKVKAVPAQFLTSALLVWAEEQMCVLIHTGAGAGQFWLITLHASSLTTQDCLPLAARLSVSQEVRRAGALKPNFLWAQVRVEVMVDLGDSDLLHWPLTS